MLQFIGGVFANAPIWVWPLFFVLLGIGIFSSKERDSSAIPYLFYPAFGLTALGSIGDLAVQPLGWQVFTGGYIVAIFAAFVWQDRLVIEKTGWHLRLKGEWGTLLILMTIFLSNFVAGTLNVVASEFAATPGFVVGFAAIIGACSGSFTGRAIRVLSMRGR